MAARAETLRRVMARLAPRHNTRRAPPAVASVRARKALARGTATLRAHDGPSPFALHPLRAAQVAAFLSLASNLCLAYADGAPPLAQSSVLAAQVAARIAPPLPCAHWCVVLGVRSGKDCSDGGGSTFFLTTSLL